MSEDRNEEPEIVAGALVPVGAENSSVALMAGVGAENSSVALMTGGRVRERPFVVDERAQGWSFGFRSCGRARLTRRVRWVPGVFRLGSAEGGVAVFQLG